jgi:hypothetical protein
MTIITQHATAHDIDEGGITDQKSTEETYHKVIDGRRINISIDTDITVSKMKQWQ